jgi:hypothetical protein
MYKKHGRDRESNLELQVKALVVKALEEQGLALVDNPLNVPSSQGSTAAITDVDRIWEPTSCTLVVLIGRQNTMIEVATGVAHPWGSSWHNNDIP